MSIMAQFTQHADNDPRAIILENDFFAQSFINTKFQKFDVELFESKWFDYRFMTPLQATECYIGFYGEIYKRVYARMIDRDRAEFLKLITVERLREGLKAGETKAKRIFTGMWRGRQFADAIGIPYDEYIPQAFDNRMRRWQQSHLPQPEHLYHPVTLEIISERWEQMKKGRLWLATHPAYMVQNYVGTPAQDAYHEWCFQQAETRQNTPECLARMVNNDHLLLSKVRARLLDPDQLEAFESYLDD